MSTLVALQKEFAPFRNQYGYVSYKGNAGHNALFHGFYVSLLDRLGLLVGEEFERQKRMAQALIHPDYPGVMRGVPPGAPIENLHSHDTLKAMFWLSKRLNMTFAKDWLEHGRTHGWNWNPEAPEVYHSNGKYWRFFGMIAQAMVAAGEEPDVLHNFWSHSEMFYMGFEKKGRVEAVTLPYFICKTLKGENFLMDAFIDAWRIKKMKVYPGGLGEVFEQYGWVGHPYTRWYAGVLDV